MTNKKTILITLSVLLFVLILFPVLFLISNRIPSNPEGTIGNTAGNLNNLGLFCERDNQVFFANPYDAGSLYVMDPDESNMKKLNNARVQYINQGGDYLYYYQLNSSSADTIGFITRVNGLYRSSLNGKKVKCLSKKTIQVIQLIDDTLYYQQSIKGEEDLHLYSIGTDKKNETEISTVLINPACVQSGQIYFNGTVEDHHLYAYNTEDATISEVLSKNMWNPIVYLGYVYYMDMDHNYRLCRYHFATGQEEILTQDRVETYNLCDAYIYYQKNDTETPALKRMGLDGNNPEEIRVGNYSNINITSQYVYFQQFGADTPVYHTPTYGDIQVETFDMAQNAAVAALQK